MLTVFFSSVGVYKVQGQSKLKRINLNWPAIGRPSTKRNDDDCKCSFVHVSRLVYFLLSVWSEVDDFVPSSDLIERIKKENNPVWLGTVGCMNSCHKHDPEEGCNFMLVFFQAQIPPCRGLMSTTCAHQPLKLSHFISKLFAGVTPSTIPSVV